MTLGGLIAHLAFVEDYWLTERSAGAVAPAPWSTAPWEEDEDFDWHRADSWPQAQVWALYDAAVRRSDSVLAGLQPQHLAATSMRDGSPMNVRWVLLHLIEEYAQHAGHADLLREALDGRRG